MTNSPTTNASVANPTHPERIVFTRDELANTLTHGLGFVFSLGAVVFFWYATSEKPLGLRVNCLLFAISMATVYLCSTLSHAVLDLRWRKRMRAWDQGTIYLLIAGTYSPFMWQGSPPGWTGTIMTAVWLAAGLGFYLKVIATYKIDAVSTVTYVLLGWLPAMALFSGTPVVCVTWMVMGGLSYTLGILFLIRSHRAWFTHSLWHLAVILGSLCHCIAINKLIALA